MIKFYLDENDTEDNYTLAKRFFKLLGYTQYPGVKEDTEGKYVVFMKEAK